MSEFLKSWKFWVAIAAVVLVIVGVVLYFTVPAFKTFVLEILAAVLIFVCGAITSWLIGRNKK